MVNEFKAEMKGNELIVKPIIKREGKDGKDLRIIVPSLPLIAKLKNKYKKDGKWNIQQTESKLNE